MKKTRSRKPVSAEAIARVADQGRTSTNDGKMMPALERAGVASVEPTRMGNPCHPGEIVRECMAAMTVTAFAKQIGFPRVDLSNILHGKQSISTEVAQKLGRAFPNQDAALRLRLQNSYDRAHDADFEGTMG